MIIFLGAGGEAAGGEHCQGDERGGVWNPKAILVMTLIFYVWVTGPGLLILTASATSLRLLFS